MLAAARKLWLLYRCVRQQRLLLSTATCNSFAGTARNRGRADFWQNNLSEASGM